MKSPREYFYIFYTVSIMKSTGTQIKLKREYFLCYSGHRIQFALKEVRGLKGVMKILVPIPRGKDLKLEARPQWRIPGCSVHSPLLPRNLGIMNSGAVYSLSLCWRAQSLTDPQIPF